MAMASARAWSRRPARSRSWADHEASLLHALHREPAQLGQVHGIGGAPGRGQRRLELDESGARCRGAGPLAGQGRGAVSLGLPQPGLEQPARRVEDGGRQLGLLGDELVGQGLGEAADGRLGRGVDRGVGNRRDPAVARRGGHHHARLVRGDHPGHEGQHPVGSSEDVHPEAPPPVVRLLVPGITAAAGGHAGVVPQQMTRPVLIEDQIGQRLHRGRVGDVGDHAPNVSGRRQLGHRGLQHRRLDVGDHHPGPLVEQRLHDAPSDAGGTPGHHRHLAGKVFHATPPDALGPGPPPDQAMVAQAERRHRPRAPSGRSTTVGHLPVGAAPPRLHR